MSSLMSGRFHQIRLQLSSRNMALVNDRKYGEATQGSNRQIGLWAYSLAFPNPITQERMMFRAIPEGPIFAAFETDLRILLNSGVEQLG
ncbi:MAG: hypothetical protein MZU97_18255 [Bacillus subtilis]|nr:hypothetical protein [Bacillus subtilis]